MSKPKKKFGQTVVGKLLKASVGLINPTLGSLIQGDMSVEQVVSSIKNSDAPPEDKIKAHRVAQKLRSGCVYINGQPADAGTPFGGYRQSGNGREGGVWGLEEYLEVKTVTGWK